MSEMSEDTARALEVIEPMAKALNIHVKADRKFLYLNGQAIGIGCNSSYATIMEFVGYVFAKYWTDGKCIKIPGTLKERIRRYWFTPEQLEQVIRAEGGEYRG